MDHNHHHHHGHAMTSGPPDQLTTTTMSPLAHSNMDHSAHMDHSGHSAAANSGGLPHNMNMHMFFHGGETETILFQFWTTTETMGFLASIVAIFFLAFLYEALKFYREHLYRHSFQTVQVNTGEPSSRKWSRINERDSKNCSSQHVE